jgi:hypothetical protein
LSFLHEDLPGILATIFAIKGRDSVLFWMMAFFEGLKGGHEIMSTCDTVGDNAFGDTCGDGSFDNGSDGVHRADDFGLILWWYVEFDLLEEVFGGTKTTDNENILLFFSILVAHDDWI